MQAKSSRRQSDMQIQIDPSWLGEQVTSMHIGDLLSPDRRRRTEGVELLGCLVHRSVWREIEGGGKPHRPFVARYGNDGVHKAFHGGEVLGMPKWGQKQRSTSVGWMALRGLSADAP